MKLIANWIHGFNSYSKNSNQEKIPLTIFPSNLNRDLKGKVLFSYLESPLSWNYNSRKFRGHVNNWQSKVIAETFLNLEY